MQIDVAYYFSFHFVLFIVKNYQNVKYFDHQGSHWSPHLIHKSIWNKIGGFSKEFDPGYASDTDITMKLWKIGIRTFKGINKFRVYHFGSITTRKKRELVRNQGHRLFLKKWGISSNLFIKFYLRSNTLYDGPLSDQPKMSPGFFLEYVRCKFKLFYLKLFKF